MVKITSLELENIKRIKAVAMTPAPSGLTVIGGDNRQGKSTVLDAIAYALGGARFRPTQPQRDGAQTDPHLKVTLSNGIIVERKGKNGALTVTDPSGKKGGQQLLNSFLSELALDLPRFLEASDKEKADTLLQIVGVKDTLIQLDSQEADLYSQRHYIGQQAQKQAKLAEGLPYVEGMPEEPVSAGTLLQQHQAILLRNAENQRKRDQAAKLAQELEQIQLAREELERREAELTKSLRIARADAADLQDQSTREIEENLRQIDQINRNVELNRRKNEATRQADLLARQYQDLTREIEEVRTKRTQLLDRADLPLPGLSVEQGKLFYQGKAWDCMSGADRLMVAVAIVRRLNPSCGFVLVDKLEQMDLQTLTDFGRWLSDQGLQAIATRVSQGPECSIIIEDGCALERQPEPQPLHQSAGRTWEPGRF